MSKRGMNILINNLENFNIIIWYQNDYIKKIQKLRFAFYVLATNEYFDIIILVIVFINSIIMALDGNFFIPEVASKINITNYIFNFIFEYVIKITGITPLV